MTDATRALANYLEIKLSEADNLINDGKWVVLTEDEANERVVEDIKSSLWAFNYSFLKSYSPAIAAIPETSWVKLASELCEDLNDAILAMVDDIDALIEDAIEADGLGHFLSTYDGCAYDSDEECTCNLDDTYIMFRV